MTIRRRMASPGGPTVFTAITPSRESLWSAVRFATGGSAHEPAHGARAGVDAGRVARDHARVVPSAGELHVAGGGPARGKLDGEPDAPAVRRPAPFEAGCGAGGREPAGDLMHPEADDRIGRRRLRRRVQPAERGGAATDQLPDIVLVRRRVRLRPGYGDADDVVVADGQVDVGPTKRRHLAAAQGPVENQRDDRAVRPAPAAGAFRGRRPCRRGGACAGGAGRPLASLAGSIPPDASSDAPSRRRGYRGASSAGLCIRLGCDVCPRSRRLRAYDDPVDFGNVIVLGRRLVRPRLAGLSARRRPAAAVRAALHRPGPLAPLDRPTPVRLRATSERPFTTPLPQRKAGTLILVACRYKRATPVTETPAGNR